MFTGTLVFFQLIQNFPWHRFYPIVQSNEKREVYRNGT